MIRLIGSTLKRHVLPGIFLIVALFLLFIIEFSFFQRNTIRHTIGELCCADLLYKMENGNFFHFLLLPFFSFLSVFLAHISIDFNIILRTRNRTQIAVQYIVISAFFVLIFTGIIILSSSLAAKLLLPKWMNWNETKSAFCYAMQYVYPSTYFSFSFQIGIKIFCSLFCLSSFILLLQQIMKSALAFLIAFIFSMLKIFPVLGNMLQRIPVFFAIKEPLFPPSAIVLYGGIAPVLTAVFIFFIILFYRKKDFI